VDGVDIGTVGCICLCCCHNCICSLANDAAFRTAFQKAKREAKVRFAAFGRQRNCHPADYLLELLPAIDLWLVKHDMSAVLVSLAWPARIVCRRTNRKADSH